MIKQVILLSTELIFVSLSKSYILASYSVLKCKAGLNIRYALLSVP